MRKKVLLVGKELGYTPTPVARRRARRLPTTTTDGYTDNAESDEDPGKCSNII